MKKEKIMNEEKVNEILNGMNDLRIEVAKIIDIHPFLSKDEKNYESIDFIEGFIYIEWEAHWRYGGYEKGSYQLPLSYLWNPKWLDEVLEEDRKAKEAAEKYKQEEVLKKADESTKKELAELDRLRKKYNV